jgi:hypothetical protein
MESRVKRYRLIHDPEIPIELFELAAHGRELAGQCRGIARIFVGAEHTIEGYFDKRRFGSARTAGRFRQSRGHTFGEINTNSGFHGKIPLKATDLDYFRSRRINSASAQATRLVDARRCNCKTA